MNWCILLLVMVAALPAGAAPMLKENPKHITPARAERVLEAQRVFERQQMLTRDQLEMIRYWDAGPPSYRWNQIAINIVRADQSGVRPERALALLNIAIHDAIVTAEHRRKQIRSPRPKTLDGRIKELVRPQRDSGPSDRAAAAAAAQAVLAHLLPSQAQYIKAKADMATDARVLGGVSLPSDIEAGAEIGRQAAEDVIRWTQNDGSSLPWKGTVPSKPGSWTGKDPEDPQVGKWKTIILKRGDQFRPEPPPPMTDADMKDLTIPTSRGMKAAAYRWRGTPVWQQWNEVLGRKVLEDRIEDPEKVASAYAMMHTAIYDALVASSDAKYEYWGIRPVQFDPKFKNLIATPNSPGYPSSNAMLSAAAARVLGKFFPADEAAFWTMAEEAAYSAIWAGLHFKLDTDTGLKIGKEIGELTVREYKPNLLQGTTTTSARF